ncbi:MAG TPA: GNAT family N-acetyltransferase [Betaproteobacteria bacterium]|nr:GNAT family N-acetyltransferase [Betaproteobacteria bacterium]
MNIRMATTDTEITACYPIMRELRPRVAGNQFLSRIRRQENTGYRLAFVLGPDDVAAMAGFRVSENLAWGRFLHSYIDDFVTLPVHRSKSHGAKLRSWLKEYAVEASCLPLHLDSGMQRTAAHRLYEREGMAMAGIHFVENLASAKVS